MTPVTPNTAVSRDTPVTWTRVCVGGSAGCSGETGREVVLRVTEEPCAPTPQRGAEGLTSPHRGRPCRTWRAPGLAPDKGLRNFQGERLPGGAWRQRGGAERRTCVRHRVGCAGDERGRHAGGPSVRGVKVRHARGRQMSASSSWTSAPGSRQEEPLGAASMGSS